jgi:hypothetical protein
MSTDSVGSLAEEAAKLLAVIQGWAGDHSGQTGDTATGQASDASGTSGVEEPSDSGQADDATHVHHEGAPECRWCPLCQLARVAKATTPEVREHLSSAAVSLALAFKGLLEGVDDTARRSDPIEKIDLDADLGVAE